MPPRLPLILLVLAALAGSARAEVEVVLPLGGYYQPGRYVPVRVRVTSGLAAEVTLSAAGAVPTVVPGEALAGGRVATVPWLPVTGAATELRATAAGHPPRLISLTRVLEAERLVAVTGGEADLAAARKLFPGKRVLPVIVQHVGEGTPAAWEALDAAVLDHMPESRHVTALSAAGVTLAVRAAGAPRDGWPWELRGGYWVLPAARAGPSGAIVSDAYDPPQMWNPGRPAPVRRAAVTGLVVFALLATGLSLLRPRWAAAAVVVGSAAACVAAAAWRRGLSPVMEANGAVIVTSDALTRRDDWIYRRHLEPADGAIAAPADDVLLKPAFASARQIGRTGITLRAGAPGEPPLFTYRLEPGWTLAFRTTRLAPARWPGEPVKPVTTPLRELAPLYLLPGRVIAGQLPDALPEGTGIPASVERWPALVIDLIGTENSSEGP
jgi:hypothetical protein